MSDFVERRIRKRNEKKGQCYNKYLNQQILSVEWNLKYYIITHLHLRQNNGMSTALTPGHNQAFSASPCDLFVQWQPAKIVLKPGSHCDQATAYTDASDHCSSSPSASNQDLDSSTQHIQSECCPDYQEGYCRHGDQCGLAHAANAKKPTLGKIMKEYPEFLAWSGFRFDSFLH